MLPVACGVGIWVAKLPLRDVIDGFPVSIMILLAGVMFIATSVCGAMPAFGWNLLMCFLMGVAVGGMLPITFALLSETVPKKHRGWMIVLIGSDIAASSAPAGGAGHAM